MVVLPDGDAGPPLAQQGDQKRLEFVILQGVNGGRQRCFRGLLIQGLQFRQRTLETAVRIRHLLTFLLATNPLS